MAVLLAAAALAVGAAIAWPDEVAAEETTARETRAGANDAGAPHAWHDVAGLSVEPQRVVLTGRDSQRQLLVSATLPAGRLRDVTREVAYRVADPRVARCSASGIVEPVSSGRTEIVVTGGALRASLSVEIIAGQTFEPLDFRRDILPILTKAGCNGGGCHGKSDGRGGFQLSLFGFDPAADYDSIVKKSRGRRVAFGNPESSLLLRKPLAELPHGGGKRLIATSAASRRLMRWIASGAPQGNPGENALARIEVSPASRMTGCGQQQQLVVTAVDRDGSRRDVTDLAEFRANDPSLATVDERGLVTIGQRHGETNVVCMYQGQVGTARLTMPLEQPRAAWPELPVASFIDRHVFARLRELRVAPSPVIDDGAFLRRAALQLAGRLPSVDEVRQFLADRRPDRRQALVDRLLASDEHADYFAQRWGDVLRNKRRNEAARIPGTVGFHRWLRNAVAENMPYDQMVRAIITATGNQAVNPPAQWYAEVRYLDRYVDDTAQVFLGLRIGCARCHNHPFERFTQDDYYGLAAFFARVTRKGGNRASDERRADEIVYLRAVGDVRHPISDEIVPPHGLDGPPIEVPMYDDPRHYLVDWMCRTDNPYFARALVNRMWAHFFGRGLVEPLDDMRSTNPASNEPLLAALADEFTRSGYDVRHLLRTIATSTTYQLSSLPNDDNLDETQCHSRFYPQRLAAEVLLDAIDSVTGRPTAYAGLPAGTRAVQLPDENYGNEFLKLFGRPPRESACECERAAKPSLSQSLFLMNDSFIGGKLLGSTSLPETFVRRDKRPEAEKIEELFLAAFARPPHADELEHALRYVRSERSRLTAYRNLLWAIVNTKEFMYVH